MRTTVCAAVAASLVLTGCAAPGTPGRGVGENYTPVIDMQGLDTNRYQADLASCRSYTQTINPAGAAVAGIIVGALLGAAVGAATGSAVGRGTRWQGSMTRYGASYGATYGATSAGLAAGGSAVVKQEVIIANCMAGRGYRTLDATIPVNYMTPSPYGNVATATGPNGPAMTPVTYAISSPPPVLKKEEIGADAYSAEQVAKAESCAAKPIAKLTGKGPGFETYSVACESGDVWAMRCEFGNCRVLR